jgi:hypothetical protein
MIFDRPGGKITLLLEIASRLWYIIAIIVS